MPKHAKECQLANRPKGSDHMIKNETGSLK